MRSREDGNRRTVRELRPSGAGSVSRIALCVALGAGLLMPQAAAGAQLRGSISASTQYDSNLTKAADEDELAAIYGTDRQLYDLISTIGAGASYSLQSSRSAVSANASINYTKYLEYDEFDAGGGQAGLNWTLDVTPNCNTGLNGTYSLRQSSFDENQVRKRNLQSRYAVRVQGRCLILGRFDTVAFAGYDQATNEAEIRQSQDREQYVYGGSFAYRTGRGNLFGVRGQYRESKFLNPDPLATQSLDFTVSQLTAFTQLALGSTLSLSFDAGHSRSEREGASSASSRPSYAASLSWSPTARTSLSFSAKQTISEIEDRLSAARERLDFALGVSHQLTGRMSARLSGNYTQDKVLNDIGEVDLLPTNLTTDDEEESVRASLGLSYSLTSRVGLTGALTYAQRMSDVALREYESYGASLSLTIALGN